MINRGDIYIADLNPVKGSETGKKRPVLIISNNINNEYSDTITIIPETSQKIDKIFPFEVLLVKSNSGFQQKSKLKCNQIRTIDKTRLIKKVGCVSEETLIKTEIALKIHLGFKQ